MPNKYGTDRSKLQNLESGLNTVLTLIRISYYLLLIFAFLKQG